MEPDNSLILDIWEVVRGYCVAKKRDELAHRLLHIFEDHGADASHFEQLLGEDFNMDNAVDEWVDEHDDGEENEYEEEYFEEDDI